MAKTIIDRKVHMVDAEGKTLGRLSTQIAVWLQGKHKASFQRHLDCGDIVEVKNVEKMHFTGKKLLDKVYYRHTGYIGHLKEENLAHLLKRKPEQVLKFSVFGMLPKNKLRARMMARLKFK
jgi:large subunit ribosomal protein L13